MAINALVRAAMDVPQAARSVTGIELLSDALGAIAVPLVNIRRQLRTHTTVAELPAATVGGAGARGRPATAHGDARVR